MTVRDVSQTAGLPWPEPRGTRSVAPLLRGQPPERLDVVRRSQGDRAFERWLWTIPSAPARREIIAALAGVLPMLGSRVVNTRWGRHLGSQLLEVTVRCHRTRGPDPVDVESHVYCQPVGRGGISIVSAWDPSFEPHVGRVQALRSTHELLGCHVRAVIDSAPVCIDYAPACIVDTGRRRSASWSPGQVCTSGLVALVEDVRAEAARDGDDVAKAFVVRCARYRIAVLLSATRRTRGLTQTELAALAGVGQSAVARLECARDGTSAETLVLVLGALIDNRAGTLFRG